MDLTRRLFELIAGYGLGGSTVALFGRVGGGIYTKAADVGADLVGKVLKDLKEDDPSNPGTIADNVGDNVGDIAGMGADLFGSLAESTCAALVVSSTSRELIYHTDALYFPLLITSMGIFASFLSVLLGYIGTVTEKSVQLHLKLQLLFSTVLMTGTLIPIVYILPETFNFGDLVVGRWTAYGCVIIGLWSGMVIGFSTEYYTSNAYGPTLSLAQSCTKGPAPNIILGLALGYNSCIIPIICLTATIGYAFTYSGMYGIGLSALGMLGSLPVALTIDGYGPISDNAGGIVRCPDSQLLSDPKLMLLMPQETLPPLLERDSLSDLLALSVLPFSAPSTPELEPQALISSSPSNSVDLWLELCSHTLSPP